MKKSTPRSRRHRNPEVQSGEKEASFFSKTTDSKVQAKEEGSFFQAKLEVAPAHDPQEKEADAVANQVVKGVKQSRGTGVQKKEQVHRMGDQEEKQAKVQRTAEQEEPAAKLQRMAEQEEPKAKLQRVAEKEEPHAKLQRMGDQEETQAKLQRAEDQEEPAAKVQRLGDKEEATAKLQRSTEKEEPAAKLNPQAKGETHKNNKGEKQKQKDASQLLEQLIKASKGKGFALPNDVRTDMEAQFNSDFTKVRIHTSLSAIKMCNMINAQAFTHGFDIYFNEGKYNPDTETGQNLLAHELTHVVQQKGV